MAEPTKTPEYPGPDLPCVFADAVATCSHSVHNVKLYLARFEPEMVSGGDAIPKNVLQLIMPIDGFIHSYAFFEKRIEIMLKSGNITLEQLDAARKMMANL
jgi:hypothetical protein